MKPILVVFAILLPVILSAQIRLNEVSVNNSSQIMDHRDKHVSWLEIYNTGNKPESLADYQLKKDDSKNFVLPDVQLPPGETMLIYTSGKDISRAFRWESLVQASDEWDYFVPAKPITRNWTKKKFDSSNWKSGPGGFGYGDEDDGTIVKAYESICIRKEFEIKDSTLIEALLFHMDFDDGFVAYLNGKELARDNTGKKGKYYRFDVDAKSAHEAVMYKGRNPKSYKISKEEWRPHLTNGKNVLAIQVFNYGEKSSDMSAIPFLTAGITSNSKQYRELPEWWTTLDRKAHTNFRLHSGETVYLLDAKGKVLDKLKCENLQIDQSRGRYPNGEGKWLVYNSSSPGKRNSDNGFDCVGEPIKTNLKSAFYSSKQLLKISNQKKFDQIRYTIDGSIPDASSPLWEGELQMSESQMVKIRGFKNDCAPSPLLSLSIFMNEDITSPVMSISIDPKKMWSEEEGIYIMGPTAQKEHPYYGANFWQEWTQPATIQYFDREKKLQLEQQVGIKINGGGSRSKPMKSLRLVADWRYGTPYMNYPFFKGRSIDKYQRILLKNSGQNFNRTHLLDAINSKLIKSRLKLDVQEYEPCIVFLNGEFFGMHNMREKYDKYYLKALYDLNLDELDFLTGSGSVAKEGDNKAYLAIRNFALSKDLSVQKNFDFVAEKIDLDNFLDWYVFQIYSCNKDWTRINNVKFWRHPDHNDHKWQFLMVDTDLTMGERSKAKENYIKEVIEDDYFHSKVFRSLLKHPGFKLKFIQRYSDVLNDLFHPDIYMNKMDEMYAAIKADMPRHFKKWPYESFDQWEGKYYNEVKQFVEDRPAYARKYFAERFDLGQEQQVTIDSQSNPFSLNTLSKLNNFNGIYFRGQELHIRLSNDEGFKYWEVNGEKVKGQKPVLKVTVDGDLAIRAVYK